MTSRPPPKKVRLACKRCRVRRIKCDGLLPACSNCAKSGEPCLDVDGKNADLLIPRNFASEARARIHWLEDIIRTRLPDVDLKSGPQIDKGAEIIKSPSAASSSENVSTAASLKRRTSHDGSSTRPDGSGSDEESFSDKAYSVAMGLGMVTLNSDSSQKHYLGASSGVLFTSLIGASSSNSAQTPSTTTSHDAQDSLWAGTPPPLSSQQATNQRSRALHFILRQELPTREEAMSLAQTYMQWVHPEFPVLEADSLFTALDALYGCSVCPMDETQQFSNGWPASLPPFRWNTKQAHTGGKDDESTTPPFPVIAFIVFAVFNVAAIVKVRRRVYGFPPDRYYRAAMLFAPDCFAQISLSTVQALLMLIIHCLHTPAEVNLWTLIHVGMAYSVELGLHREHSGDDVELRQLRRFIFYTLYSLDRSISSVQGRPLGLRDESFDVKVPETPRGEPSQISLFMASNIRYSQHNFELYRIVSETKTQLYHIPDKASTFLFPDKPQVIQQRILNKLKLWWESVFADNLEIPGVDVRQTRVWKLKLRIKYHTTMILLFQPSQSIRHPPDEAIQTVFNSATSILQDYQMLHSSSSLDFGWRTVQNVFAAGAALIYSFWTSRAVQDQTDATAISKSLRNCTSLLSIGGEWWPSAKTSLANFGSIVDLTIQRIYSKPPRAKLPRLSFHGPTTTLDQRATGTATYTNGLPETQPSTVTPDATTPWKNPPGPLDAGSEGINPADIGVGNWSTAPGPSVTPNSATAQETAAATGTTNGGETPGDMTLSTPWPLGIYADLSHAESFPEIEDFLADFDRGEFSWSVPMNDAEEPALDLDSILP